MTPLNTDKATSNIGPSKTPADIDANNFAQLFKATIMMIDDEPINIEVTMEFMEESGYHNFVSTSDSRDALNLIETMRPDVILLDLMMPHVSGFEILKEMRANNKMCRIPVIVLTSSTDAETRLKALELGANDFLAKPVDSSELVLRLRNTLAAKAYQDQLTYYDGLTGLPNRTKFVNHLDWTLHQAIRYKRLTALLHINIDRFRKINDALGPNLADEFLKAFAKRLEQLVRTCDALASASDEIFPNLSRLGGDEFTVLLVEMNVLDDASLVCQRFLKALSEPFNIDEHEILVTCSIGAAVFPADGTDGDTLLKNAGVAMRFSKQQGGNTFRFYSNELNERSKQYMALQSDLHHAIERNELQLFYQPKVNIRSGKLVGAEALIRWQHKERGLISPDMFIPLAEETGQIVNIGDWVFSEACRNIKKWSESGLPTPRISINLSGRQFLEQALIPIITNIVDDTGIDPQLITIELTESMLMSSTQKNIQLLQDLKDLGFKISLDDFGTGYSSLSYLSRFPLDEMKIDKSFISGVATGTKNISNSIVVAIIAMAHSMGLKVVAEGIETTDQLEFVRQHDCEEFQGYLFSKPIPLSEFSEMLQKYHASGDFPQLEP